MSLVIGIKTQKSIIVVSDGLALLDDKKNNQTIKKYTYSKIRTIQPGNILLGYVGSTGIYIKIVTPLIKNKDELKAKEDVTIIKERKYLDESDFIHNISTQIKKINENLNRELMKMFIGYLDEKSNPKLIYFSSKGEVEEIDDFVALGSGAKKIMSQLQKNYNFAWSIEEAVSSLIDLIYLGSEVPTVNFLPMVACLTKNGIKNYSDYTIQEFNNFKINIKSGILKKIEGEL